MTRNHFQGEPQPFNPKGHLEFAPRFCDHCEWRPGKLWWRGGLFAFGFDFGSSCPGSLASADWWFCGVCKTNRQPAGLVWNTWMEKIARSLKRTIFLAKCDHQVLWRTSFKPPWWTVPPMPVCVNYFSSSGCRTRLLKYHRNKSDAIKTVLPLGDPTISLYDVYYPVKWHILITDLRLSQNLFRKYEPEVSTGQ